MSVISSWLAMSTAEKVHGSAGERYRGAKRVPDDGKRFPMESIRDCHLRACVYACVQFKRASIPSVVCKSVSVWVRKHVYSTTATTTAHHSLRHVHEVVL